MTCRTARSRSRFTPARLLAALVGLLFISAARGQHPALTDAAQLEAQGARLLEAGRKEQALPLWERALALREAALGPDQLVVARSPAFQALVAHYREQRDFPRAEALLKRALRSYEVCLGPKNHGIAPALDALAALYLDQQAYARAEPLLLRSLQLSEPIFGPDSAFVAASLHKLATVYSQQRAYARAEPYYLRALKSYESSLGPSHPGLRPLVEDLAALYFHQGAYARAAPHYERVLALLQAQGDSGVGHDLAVAAAMINVAVVARYQGAYPRAESLLQRALAAGERAAGSGNATVASALNELAMLYFVQGTYARAEPLLQRALKLQDVALGASAPALSKTLYNLAMLHAREGAYARAEALLQRAIKIDEAASRPANRNMGAALRLLGRLSLVQGAYARAEPLLQRALTISEAALGPAHPDVSVSLNELANLYSEQGAYARAEALYQRALAITETSLGDKHPEVATLLVNLAVIAQLRAEFARAQPLLLRALNLKEAALGPAHPGLASILGYLSVGYVFQGDRARADALLERALEIEEGDLSSSARVLTDSRVSALFATRGDLRALVLSEALGPRSTPALRRMAMTIALLRKGRAGGEVSQALQGLARALRDPATPQELRDRAARLRGLVSQIAGLYARPTPDPQPALEPLLAQREALELELVRDTVSSRTWQAPPPAQIVASVANALPADGVLIDLERALDLSANLLKQGRAALHYRALLLFPDQRVQVVDLGPVDAIDQAAVRYYRQISHPAADAMAPQPAAAALYHLLLAPIVPLLGGRTRLLVCPESLLHQIPLAALHDGVDWLLGRYEFTFLTSVSQLLRPAAPPPRDSTVVVFADPDYAATGAPAGPPPERGLVSSGGPSGELAPLPGTRKEAEALRRLWPAARLQLGRQATKQALLGIRAPAVLHVATHGAYSAGLTPALVRSVLMMAPAAGRARADAESVVTAMEVAQMDLWGTQLVVLSACDSGQGDVEFSEGVAGLRRSFLGAGAETLVTSLWEVADQETQRLMTEYYQRLQRGVGRVAAMDQAALAMKRERAHPYYWASFIVLGRGDPLQGLGAPRDGVK